MKRGLMLIIGLFILFGFIGFISAGECEDAGYTCRDASCPQGTETRVWDYPCSYIGGRQQVCCRTLGANENHGQCFDSDGGKNSGFEGRTYNDVESYEDFCLVAGGTFKYATEYYCSDNAIKSETIECENACEDGACRGEVEECVIEEGEGICEFMGETYSIKHTGCNEDVSLEISYDGKTVYSEGRKQGGINSLLLDNGVLIKVDSSPCATYLAHLSFQEYRVPQVIASYGLYEVYHGDKINFANVDAEIYEISWALSGDTAPKVKIIANNAQSFSLKQDEERVFTYGAVSNPITANLGIRVLSFGLDQGSPTRTRATIELFPVETEEVLNPVESEELIDVDEETLNFFCNGCKSDNKCYPFGYRKNKQFCSDGGNFLDEFGGGNSCENNFECKSNVCVNDECISRGLLQRILDWFRRLFGSD